MKGLIEKSREALLSAPDTVCLERARLVTEAYRRHADAPAPIRRAKAFAHVLRNMTLDLDSNPVFAGNTSTRPRAWMLVPEHGFGGDAQIEIEHEGLAGFLDPGEDDKVPRDLRGFWAGRSFGGTSGIGHLAVDMERVVGEGLESVLEEARRFAGEGTREERAYREAMAIAVRAVIDWSARYADAAEAASRAAGDPELREAHLRVARACRQVPARPARDLFEGLQAMLLVHLAVALEGHGMSVSVGLPDRALARFVDADFDGKRATELVAAFMLKIAANSLYGRGSKTQAITVGGLDADGRDRCGELTMCFLDACDLVRVGDPHLFLRWHEKIDDGIRRRAAEMLAAGASMPLLVNDSPTVRGLVAAGIDEDDARDYCVIGCNELGVPGRSCESATVSSGTVQHLDVLNRVLLGHPEPDSITGTEEILSLMEREIARDALAARRAGRERRERAAREVPTPFTSALMRGCVRRGRDMLVGMEYHVPGLYERGIVNAANALAALDQRVFEERGAPMRDVVRAMEEDFAGEWASLREALVGARKWGSDDERADRFLVELLEMRERALDHVDREAGDRSHSVCHVVRSLHHVDGRRIAASPDGRNARAPVADSVGAVAGTARAGPTAVLNSVLRIDAARHYRGGYNLNLTLSRRDATPGTVLALAEAFFARGGQELQVAVLDASALRDARECPERHGDLVVRVAGFSARFVDLSPLEQEELVRRAEAAERR